MTKELEFHELQQLDDLAIRTLQNIHPDEMGDLSNNARIAALQHITLRLKIGHVVEDKIHRPTSTMQPVLHLDGRASLHFSHNGDKCHIGVRFDTPNTAENQERRMHQLWLVCDALSHLEGSAGQQWDGAELLHFPGASNATA